MRFQRINDLINESICKMYINFTLLCLSMFKFLCAHPKSGRIVNQLTVAIKWKKKKKNKWVFTALRCKSTDLLTTGSIYSVSPGTYYKTEFTSQFLLAVISLNTYSLVINPYLTHSLLITDRLLGQYIYILRYTFPKATAEVAISKTKLSPLFAGAARLIGLVPNVL